MNQSGPLLNLPRGQCSFTDSPGARRGFTLVEVIIVIGIIAILSAIVLTMITRSRSAATSAQCVANIHAAAVGLTTYAHDHGLRFPDPTSLNMSWEQTIRPYIPSPRAFQCPGDSEIYPIVGSSYDWRDTGNTSTTLAGMTLSSFNRMNTVLVFESLPGWHQKQRMNAALVDGSTQNMAQTDCIVDLQTAVR